MAKPTIENKGAGNLSAMLLAAWAIVLLVVFLAYRSSDIGQLPMLIGNLDSGLFFGVTGFRDSVVGAVVAGVIATSWFGLGSFVSSFVKVSKDENHSHLLELSIKTATGAAICSLIWFFLGIAGAYNGVAAIVVTAIGLALAVLSFQRIREARDESRVPDKPTRFDKILMALIAVPMILAFVASMSPATAKDTLLYHFAVPKAFVAQGSNTFIEGNIASYLALGTEMQNVWAMLLGGFVSQRAAEAAAGATNFIFFPLLLLAIYGWARELNVERRLSLTAVLIAASVPTAFYVGANAYTDLSLALFVTLAIYNLCRWWKTLAIAPLVFAAIFLGAALSIKVTTVFVVAAFALIILLRARQAKSETTTTGAGNILTWGFGALIAAAFIAAPWYLRTWQATGSPVFPFYMSIWPGDAVGWDVERSNLFQAMNSQYGGAEKTAADYLLAPWNVSVMAQPEQAAFFDGVLGVAFLLGLPILIWALWKFDLAVEIKIGVGVAGIMFLFWLFSSQQLRYLLPIVPVLAIAITAAGQRIANGNSALRNALQGSLTAAAVAGILVSAAWFLQKAPLRVVLGGETRGEYLSRNLDYYPYYQTLNTETPPDAKVWLINMRRDTYNLDRPVVSDYLFEDWTLRQMVWESRNVQELKAKTAAMGVQYVLTRHDFLFDYDRSTIVDDKKPRAENEAKLKIAREFVLGETNIVRADKKFSLIKVF
jgi:hypothetical protein